MGLRWEKWKQKKGDGELGPVGTRFYYCPGFNGPIVEGPSLLVAPFTECFRESHATTGAVFLPYVLRYTPLRRGFCSYSGEHDKSPAIH